MNFSKAYRATSSGLIALTTVALTTVFATSCADDDATQQAPKIYFASEGSFEISPDDTLALEPRIIYDYGCSYLWSDGEGNVLSTDRELSFVPPAMRDYSLIFEVSNSLGSDAYGIEISVQRKATFGDLDNFTTKKSSVLALVPDSLPGAFRWRDVEFNNVVNSDTTFWAGFAFCNRTTVTNTISNSAMGTAYATGTTTSSSSDKSYMAVNAEQGMGTIKFGRAYTPKSLDVATDNFIYLASKFGYRSISSEGDTTLVSPAAQGDYYTVVIEGLNADGSSNGLRQEYKLIDCDFNNPAKYYRCSAWVTLDLTPLGDVYGLKVSIETSKSEFPELVCIDNLRLQD